MTSNHSKLLHILAALLLAPLFFFLLLVFLYRYDNKYTANCILPAGGLLALSEQDLEEVPYFVLSRQWQFYPDVLLTPQSFAEGSVSAPMQLTDIGRYRDFSLGDPARSTQGLATYRLLLSLPQTEQIYSLVLPEIYSSYRFYVGGTLVLEMGNPDPADYMPCIGSRTVIFSASGQTELLLCVNNASHYHSGMTCPPILGLAERISRMSDIRLFFSFLMTFGTLFVCLGFLYVGLAARQKQFLLFSLLCFCYIGYSIHSMLLSCFVFTSRIWYVMELLCTYGFYLLLVLLQSLFPRQHPVFYRVTVLVLTVFCIYAVIYASVPPESLLSHQIFAWCSLAVKILTAVYLIWNALLITLHNTQPYLLLLCCTVCFSVSLLADRCFPPYEPILGRWFAEYGGLMIIGGLSFTLFEYFVRTWNFQRAFAEEKKQYARQASLQKEHYMELSEKIETASRQRHDMRHHLRVITSLIQNQENEKALEYLQNYQIAENGQSFCPLCPNLVIDAMLQYYKKLAQKQGILLEVIAQIPPRLTISDTDLAILFGNLLENALESCARQQIADARIILHSRFRDGKLFLRIENPILEPTLKKNGLFLSSKNGRCGVGTRSVKAVVKQYDGIIDFEESERHFCVSVVLPVEG